MRPSWGLSFLSLAVLMASPALHAQPAKQASSASAEVQPRPADTPAGGPAPLVIRFDEGSSELRPRDRAVLDKASRAYNEGKPIVMIVTGMADRIGSPRLNLTLSQRRAEAVLRGLLDRGIPADRFQVLAKGQTDLPVATKEGVAEPENRRVEITWR